MSHVITEKANGFIGLTLSAIGELVPLDGYANLDDQFFSSVDPNRPHVQIRGRLIGSVSAPPGEEFLVAIVEFDELKNAITTTKVFSIDMRGVIYDRKTHKGSIVKDVKSRLGL